MIPPADFGGRTIADQVALVTYRSVVKGSFAFERGVRVREG